MEVLPDIAMVSGIELLGLGWADNCHVEEG